MDCGKDPTKLECLVPMEVFEKCKLDEGEQVQDKVVIRAKNAAGISPPSLYNMLNPAVEFIRKPEPMIDVEKQIDEENIFLKWIKQEKTTYNVYLKQKNESEFENIAQLSDSKYTIDNLNQSTNYTYKI